MRNTCPSEERYPLLLLFLEDGQRPAKESKRIFFDRGRYQGITSGVTTVITQWPGHLATCLTTALFIGLVIILFTMFMLVMSIMPPTNFLTARCKKQVYNYNNISTVVHLVHGPRPWTSDQIHTLEEIIIRYGSSNIDLVLIQNNTQVLKDSVTVINSTTNMSNLNGNMTKLSINTTKRFKRNSVTHTKKNISLPFQFNINAGPKSLIQMLLDPRNFLKRQLELSQNLPPTTITPKKMDNFSELLQKYPNISIQNITYDEFFKHTPLLFTWRLLNEATQLFAIRVMQIWNYAGITFDLPDVSEFANGKVFLSSTENKIMNYSDSLNLDNYTNLVRTGLSFFENLPEGLVTVDEKGLHMETKTICHAFFGEMLIKLRKANNKTTPAILIQDTLRSFCIRGAVDKTYCKKILI